jgi:CubicO group peptidase (beta-lactamase class C family)
MGQSMLTTAAAGADWLSISPSEAGFTSDLEAPLDKAIKEKRVWNLHGVVVVRKGRLVLERYFEGDDNARGSPLGAIAFKADTLHDLRSVSKSIVGLLYGIALAESCNAGCDRTPALSDMERASKISRGMEGANYATSRWNGRNPS